jgi:membrane-bound ClpP family serine protease
MTLKFSDLKQKSRDLLAKLLKNLHEYNLYISLLSLIVIYIIQPELRWVYPIAIGGIILILGVLVIICCPLFVLIAILAPILWISEKLHGKQIEKQE